MEDEQKLKLGSKPPMSRSVHITGTVTGPNGEKRPSDANQNAVMIAKIATGQIKKESLVPPVGLEPTTHSSQEKALSN